MMHYCLFETAIGTCGLAWKGAAVTRLQLPETDPDATARRVARSAEPGEPPPAIAAVISDLQRYFSGDRVDLTDIALDLSGVAAFHLQVYQAARTIGWGRTETYGGLARRLGAPDAARAVGQALGRNPVPIIVPCHRVVAAGRTIGGFSAAGGAVTKARLLALEGIPTDFGAPRLPGL